jgi:hypothetical protein
MIPDFEYQSGDVSFTIYVRDRPQTTPAIKGPYVLAKEPAGYHVADTVGNGVSSVEVSHFSNQGGTIASGRTFTFAGVNAWAAGADTGELARFTTTAPLTGPGTLSFTPPVRASGGTRNVVSLPADNAEIVVLGNTGKKDFRASGRIMAIKFSGSGVHFRLGKPLFDVVPLGER